MPTSLQALIGSRLDRLGRPEKQVAQHASVVGSVFWAGAVAHLGSETPPDADLAGRVRDASSAATSSAQQEPSSVADERSTGSSTS